MVLAWSDFAVLARKWVRPTGVNCTRTLPYGIVQTELGSVSTARVKHHKPVRITTSLATPVLPSLLPRNKSHITRGRRHVHALG
jgi:hypothetical protein